MAEVECDHGKLFLLVGFMMSNLSAKARGVVALCSGRGAVDQWIEEGQYTLNWTRLS